VTAPLTVCISAGEPSGDVYAGMLARELIAQAPSVRVVGMGGRELAEAGAELLIDIRDSSVLGLVEVLRAVPAFLRKRRALVDWMRDNRPDVLVTVDFPDFNLGLAARARALGAPVVCLIPPKAWAWRRRRGATVAQVATRVLCVLPFAADFYASVGADVEFIGHPLRDTIDALSLPPREDARRALGLSEGGPLLGLLPGSRTREVSSLLPPMLDGLDVARTMLGPVHGAVALSASASDATVGRVTEMTAGRDVHIVRGRTYEAIRASDAVLAASGTVTLECALVGTPMVIAYKLSSTTYRIVRRVVRVDYSGLPNLLVGRGACPEYYQDDVNGPTLGRAASELLADGEAREAQIAAFAEARAVLGPSGAMARGAAAVLATAAAAKASPPL
jgi:lipid-A-disaccharide synthase